MKVFLSYKREYETFARSLSETIKSWGYDVWLDVADIRVGDYWDAAIHEGIKESTAVVGLMEPESLESPNVLDEWHWAVLNSRLVLIKIHEVSTAEIPPFFIRINYIDYVKDHTLALNKLHEELAFLERFDGKVVSGRPSAPKIARDEASAKLLKRVKTQRVDKMLEDPFYKGDVARSYARNDQSKSIDNYRMLRASEYAVSALPAGTKILDIFDQVDRCLLILGDPGSGKTTAMLELARDLISLAELDGGQPVPVILNLSSWSENQEPLHEWVQHELNSQYNVAPAMCKQWIDVDQLGGRPHLVLLLDGLDEVQQQYREVCVARINEMKAAYGDCMPFAVCSRIADYDLLKQKLNLSASIVIQPLGEDQVDRYFESLGHDYQELHDMLAADLVLRSAVDTPLMLRILVTAYQGLAGSALPKFDSVEKQRKYLLASYVDHVERAFSKDCHQLAAQYPRKEALHTLGWMASRMQANGRSEFYMERLKGEWLPTAGEQNIYKLVVRLIFGLSIIVPTWLVFVTAFEPVWGSSIRFITAPAAGLTLALAVWFGRKRSDITVRDAGLLSIVAAIFLGSTFALAFGPVIGATIGVGFGLFVFFAFQLIGRKSGLGGATQKTDDGIYRSSLEEDGSRVEALGWNREFAIRGFVLTVIFALLLGLAASTLFGLYNTLAVALAFATSLGLLAGVTGDEFREKDIARPNQGFERALFNAGKTVHYFLMEYESGSEFEHDHEMDEVKWVSIEEAIGLMGYKGAQDVLRRAQTRLHTLSAG